MCYCVHCFTAVDERSIMRVVHIAFCWITWTNQRRYLYVWREWLCRAEQKLIYFVNTAVQLVQRRRHLSWNMWRSAVLLRCTGIWRPQAGLKTCSKRCTHKLRYLMYNVWQALWQILLKILVNEGYKYVTSFVCFPLFMLRFSHYGTRKTLTINYHFIVVGEGSSIAPDNEHVK